MRYMWQGYSLLSLFSHSFPSKERFIKKNTVLFVNCSISEKVNSQWQVSGEEKARTAINIGAQFVSNWFLSRHELETTRKISAIN